jgi:hypothetical protein
MNRSHESESSSLTRPVSIHLHGLNDNMNSNTQTSIYKQVFLFDEFKQKKRGVSFEIVVNFFTDKSSISNCGN